MIFLGFFGREGGERGEGGERRDLRVENGRGEKKEQGGFGVLGREDRI